MFVEAACESEIPALEAHQQFSGALWFSRSAGNANNCQW